VAPAASDLATLRGSDLSTALAGRRVAIPGELTTAALLYRLFSQGAGETTVLRYDRIMPAVAEGEVDAGVIIHESRFTYQLHGLHCLQDLGDWWEEVTEYPIPLGGIAVRRDLGPALARAADRAVRASLARARAHPAETEEYIRQHAQEMQAEVCREHIELYVNEYSEDYGDEGALAIARLFEEARRLGVAPRSERPLFWDG
jgi:1,4-dihydroxy-6-naphthoate synthase